MFLRRTVRSVLIVTETIELVPDPMPAARPVVDAEAVELSESSSRMRAAAPLVTLDLKPLAAQCAELSSWIDLPLRRASR